MKKKKMSFVYYILLLIAVALLGYSVYNYLNQKDKTKTTNNDPKDSTKEEEVVKKLQIIDLDSDSRPYAVMINNLSLARPYQSGLQDAYIVYEIIVEGGITRYMAVFKDQETARIGSVRSSRHYFLDYALENDAIYVHFGWSPQAQSDMTTLKVNNINGLYDNAFWRDETLPVAYEHTAFTSMENIEKMATRKGYRLTSTKDPVFNYSIDEINLDKEENATQANRVSIVYSTNTTTSYVYNLETKVYGRSVNGAIQKDYVTKKQITAKNIIVALVANGYIADDAKGRQELENVGTGDGYYITNGYAIPIKWNKESRSSQTIYTKINGDEIDVNDGNTFIQIAPKTSTTITE
jgi:hypothetical protein